MKLTVKINGEIIKTIKAEYTPAEAVVLICAMRRFAEDEDVNEADRAIMQQMLSVKVKPEEEESESDA